MAEARDRRLANLARLGLVGGPGETARLLAAAWKAAVPPPQCLGPEERALARVHSLLGPVEDPLWAPATREAYERALGDSRLWHEANRGLLAAQGRVREGEGLGVYLQGLAEDISGEALWRRGKALLRVLSPLLGEQEARDVWGRLRVLRREANKLHPPRAGGATPISLQDLAALWGRAQESALPPSQREAPDILAVAFATVSRAGEIAALELQDVAEDGSWVRVRPKTSAATWRRLVKRVDDAPGLPARSLVKAYRLRAANRGQRLLWEDEERGGVRPTASISSALKDAARALGFGGRVTAHSARKGAALEALFAGAPLPVIQAFGGWARVDTLQAYLAEGVRRASSVLQVVLGGRGEEKEEKKGKEETERDGLRKSCRAAALRSLVGAPEEPGRPLEEEVAASVWLSSLAV